MTDDRPTRLAEGVHDVLRVGAGLLFLQHGAQKLFGWFGGLMGQPHPVPLDSLMGVAGVIELFGGALLVLGLLTRPVAFVAFVEMVAAYLKAHAPQGGAPIENHGEVPLLYALIWLYFAGTGAGVFSLDHLIRRRLGTERRGRIDVFDDGPFHHPPA